MTRIEAVVAGIGAANDGIVLRAHLEKAGVARTVSESLRRRGVLVSVARGVDRLRDHPFTWRSQCRALLGIGGEGAVLGLRTAGRLQAFYAYRRCDAVEALVRRGSDQRTPFGRIVQTRWLPPDHTTVVDELPCTTVARTFFDLCGDPDWGLKVSHPAHEQAMVRVYNDALGRRGMTFTQEAAVLLVMAKRGRSGTQLARSLLERFGPGYVPTDSDAETLFLTLLGAYDLPEGDTHVPVVDDRGFIGVVDFLWRDAKVVVEIDSSWHDGPVDKLVDKERDARLEALGYEVLLFRYGDLIRRPGAVAVKLGVALRRGRG